MERYDFAIASKENTEILVFNTTVYKEIISKTLQNQAEKKIDFLLRFGPKLRDAGRNMVQDFEIMFVKYLANKGF